jgi:hypothetical protein
VSCGAQRDEVLLLLGGLLEPERAEWLQSHLASGCETCQRRLAEARELELDLALGLEPVEPHPSLKTKLLARIARDAAPRRTLPGWRLAAVAAGLVLAAGLGFAVAWLATSGAPRGPLVVGWANGEATPAEDERTAQLASLRESLEEADDELAELEDQVRQLGLERDQLADELALLRSPEVQVIALTGTPGRPEASGRLFWQSGEGYYCYLHATGLTPGRAALALWVETEEGDTFLVASFEADPEGGVEVWVELPHETRRLVRAFVTAEPKGVGARPDGPLVLSPAS